MLRTAKNRAERRGHEFSIMESDVVIPAVCPILGMPLVDHIGEFHAGGCADSPPLDRIDNTKGYVKGNVQVISRLANTMKGSATKAQLISFAKWVLETHTDE